MYKAEPFRKFCCFGCHNAQMAFLPIKMYRTHRQSRASMDHIWSQVQIHNNNHSGGGQLASKNKQPMHYQQRPRCSSDSTAANLYRLGNGAATRAARLPDERGLYGSGSSGSIVKLTPRSSDELTQKPPATRGLRNRSLRPCPYLTHSSVTETMVTPERGAGFSSPLFFWPQYTSRV